jgi:hypothetical protein
VGPRAGLHTVEKRKILHYRESNPGRPDPRYTDWAIPTLPSVGCIINLRAEGTLKAVTIFVYYCPLKCCDVSDQAAHYH